MPASIRPLRVALVCAVLTSGCLLTMVAHAQGNPLDLDPSFAGDGTLEIQLALNDYAAVGVFEGSGEIVVFGDSAPANPSNREGIMQRITADGTPLTPARFPAQEFGCSVPRAFFSGIRLSTGDYLAGGFRQASCGGLPRVFSNLQLQSSGGITQTFDRLLVEATASNPGAPAEVQSVAGRALQGGAAKFWEMSFPQIKKDLCRRGVLAESTGSLTLADDFADKLSRLIHDVDEGVSRVEPTPGVTLTRCGARSGTGGWAPARRRCGSRSTRTPGPPRCRDRPP